MPASEKYTLIRLMRGKLETSESWIPEIGEPLLDMETGTLRYGDAEKLGGIPINTVTAVEKTCPVNLNEQKIWGRFFLRGEIVNGPDGIGIVGSYFLVVETSSLGGQEIWQTLKVMEGDYYGKTFTRMTMDKGISWSNWRDISYGGGYDTAGSGAQKGDTNINNYINNSEVYIEDIINGPMDTEGCEGFLTTKRSSPDSPYVFQQLIIVGCPKHGGKIFYRYSVDGNNSWKSPGYNWKELTDYVTRDLSNATGILATLNGGTGRNNGSIAQADHANESDHTLISDKLGTTNIGSATRPMYLNAGVATQCDVTLSNSISGKAATAGVADKLGTVNIGSATLPMYLNAGVATVCGNTLGVNITGNAATSDTAGGSGKKTIGSATQPVYLNNGIITVCSNKLGVNISGKADTAGTADIANKTKYN